MNRKSIISLIIILIIAIGCYSLYLIIKPSEKAIISPEEEKDILLDILIKDSDYAEEYYNCMALVNENLDYCNDSENQETCASLYSWDISLLKEESYCNKLFDEQNITCIAFHRKDSGICSTIKDESKRNYCLGIVTQDISYCEAADDEGWANSYDCKRRNKFISAVRNKDILLCGEAKLDEFNMVSVCKAIILKNDTYCLNYIRDKENLTAIMQ